MKQLMDEVEYNRDSQGLKTLRLVKKKATDK